METKQKVKDHRRLSIRVSRHMRTALIDVDALLLFKATRHCTFFSAWCLGLGIYILLSKLYPFHSGEILSFGVSPVNYSDSDSAYFTW